jgi:hypothetical protein
MSAIDSRWEVWDAQALTTEEYSHTNGTLIDLEEDGVTDESISDRLWLNIKVSTAFATLTEGCYFAVVTSDSSTFATGNKCFAAIGCEDHPLTTTELTAGECFSIAFVRYGLLKYLGILFEPISTAASAGAVDAWFGLEPAVTPMKRQKAPDGYTIS